MTVGINTNEMRVEDAVARVISLAEKGGLNCKNEKRKISSSRKDLIWNSECSGGFEGKIKNLKRESAKHRAVVQILVTDILFHVGLSHFLDWLTFQDGTFTLKMSQAKAEGEKHMWGHSPTQKDEIETGGPLFARTASVTPVGCVPHLAALQLRAGTGEDTIHSDRHRRGGREAPQTYGMRHCSQGTVGLLVCGHMEISKGQTAGSYLLSKSMVLRFKAFLPVTSSVGCGRFNTG